MSKTYQNYEMIESTEKIANKILSDKHSNHHRDHFFPLLINELGLKNAAEIGVDKGEFSEHLLSKSKLEKLYCVDPWIDDFGSDYRPEAYDPNGNNRMQEALKRLEKFGNRVVPIKETSVEASKQITDLSLDFCYIDGDHSLAMLFDLYSWVPKLKIGSICSGHDYKNGKGSGISNYFGQQLDYQVKTCVDYYCERFGYKLNIVGGRILSWWFVKNY